MKAMQRILPEKITMYCIVSIKTNNVSFNKLHWKDTSWKKPTKQKLRTILQPQINEAYTHMQLIFISDQRGFEVQINLLPNSFSTGLSLNIWKITFRVGI